MIVGTGTKGQGGFTLIEVLVSLLVLLIGLLGVVGMQYLSLQQVNNSNLRSQVNLHVQEMVERIRANDNSALTPAEVTAWESAMERYVPEADTVIQFNANTVDITVTWDERQYDNDAAAQSYTLTARLTQ